MGSQNLTVNLLEWLPVEERRQGFVELEQKFDAHIERFNDFENEVRDQWSALYDLLEGPELRHLDGTRYRTGGLIADIKDIRKQMANGGVKVKLSPGMWTVLASMVAGIFGILASLIAG